MKALLTRPLEAARPFAARLHEAGIDAVISPLLDIRPMATAIDTAGVAALALTSRNALMAEGLGGLPRDIPVFAVGAATAAAATDAGFLTVFNADGDGNDLADLIREHMAPGAGAILHPGGRHRAGDLAGTLASNGFQVRSVTVYEAVAVTTLPRAARQALLSKDLDAVVFFSPRTAGTFVSLLSADIDSAALNSALKGIAAIAISDKVANLLAALPWRRIRVAGDKSAVGVIAALQAEAEEG